MQNLEQRINILNPFDKNIKNLYQKTRKNYQECMGLSALATITLGFYAYDLFFKQKYLLGTALIALSIGSALFTIDFSLYFLKNNYQTEDEKAENLWKNNIRPALEEAKILPRTH